MKPYIMKAGRVKVNVNQDSCQGCRACEAQCSLKNFGMVNPKYTGIKILEPGELGKFTPIICAQCEDIPCAGVCPQNSIVRDGYSGAVIINDTCTGCGSCIAECPIGAINLIKADEKIKAFKCNLCNGQPQCVNICPRNAIGW